jgi:transposase-like protein
VPECPKLHRGHRFPAGVIAHAVRLYLRFALSLRDVEELRAARGIQVSYETVRRWVAKFGPCYAAELRRREARRGRTWHLDGMATRVGGRLQCLGALSTSTGRRWTCSYKSSTPRAPARPRTAPGAST